MLFRVECETRIKGYHLLCEALCLMSFPVATLTLLRTVNSQQARPHLRTFKLSPPAAPTALLQAKHDDMVGSVCSPSMMMGLLLVLLFVDNQNKQTNKQTNKQINKQTNKTNKTNKINKINKTNKTIKQTNKQINK